MTEETIPVKAIVVTDQAAGTAGMTLVERPEPPASAFVREDSGTATGPALLVDQRQPRGQGGEGPIGPPRIRDTKLNG